MGPVSVPFDTQNPSAGLTSVRSLPIPVIGALVIIHLALFHGSSLFASPVKVVDSDPHRISLVVENLDLQWQEVQLQEGEIVLFDPVVGGVTTSGEPGRVRIPTTGGWLLVPPGTLPRVRTRQENWTTAGNRPLMVQGIPIMIQGADPDFKTTSEIFVLPGDEVPAGALIPEGIRAALGNRSQSATGPALELGEIVWWRGHRIVSWQLNFLHHDGRMATDGLSSGQWEIAFEETNTANEPIPPGHSAIVRNRNDERFSGIFLNANIMGNLPSEARYRGSDLPAVEKLSKRGGKSGSLLAPLEGRLGVEFSRLYRVSYESLHTFGFIPDQPIQESQMRLYQRRYLERLDDGSGQAPYVEVEVPILMFGEGDAFDGDDFFIFYGLRLRDDTAFMADVGQGLEEIIGCGDNQEKNNTANYYWVAASDPDPGQSWARMQESTMAAASGEPLANYRRQEHHEQQVAYRENPPQISSDRLFMNYYKVADVSVGIDPLWNPDPNGSDVSVGVQVTGYSTTEFNLHFEIVTDNTLVTPVEDYLLADNDLVTRRNFIPASALAGEECKLVMSPNSGNYVYSWLNWVELGYDALYRAIGNTLQFHGNEDPGARPMVVTGFTTDDIGLFEITDPRNPIHYNLDSSNIVADGDNWKLSLEPIQSSGTRHFVSQGNYTGLGVGDFNYYESTRAEDPVNPVELSGPAPDLVVITHPDFREALERWITHRKNRADGDLEVHVVEVQDLYDWYSGGLKDPWALKRFSNHAISHWKSWALMLVGDANENALQLGVQGSARDGSRDLVPTNHHIQTTWQYKPEVASSDKWYATFESGMNYPDDDFLDSINSPWEMYVGRFPCNNVTELNVMIDKVMAMENVQPNQEWRKRAIMIGDDHWSEGSGVNVGKFVRSSLEWHFSNVSRNTMAPLWTGGSPVVLEADTLFLNNYLRDFWIEDGSPNTRVPSTYQNEVVNGYAHRDLLASLNSGGLIAHYQGHANEAVLCSEIWFEDKNNSASRQDVQFLTNAERPWVFFGMGCHISDWAQDPVTNGTESNEPSLGEKFLTWAGGGACATYGSSVYEYISQNKEFGEFLMRRWIEMPPNRIQVPGSEEPSAVRSRWMLGELLWSSEADLMARYVTSPSGNNVYRDMVTQYVLLGDPLMMMDAGPAVVSAVMSDDPGRELTGEEDLVSGDVSNLKIINVEARDEAGIARLRVTDSTGADLTSSVVTESLPEGEDDHQLVNYRLDVPLRPFDHQIQVEVFDTGGALSTDRHYALQLNVAQTAVFTVNGTVYDGNYPFVLGEPVTFQCELTSGAWLDDSMEYSLKGENLEVGPITMGKEKSNNLSFSFTATATEDSTKVRAVILEIDNHATTYTLAAGDEDATVASISKVLNYPNPMREETRFIFETTETSGKGTVRVFAVSGRIVANLPFTFSESDEPVISWNGLDSDGDRLANGTYLYRLEMNTSAGLLVSPMQRLVVMN
jgi:Peptidase family C25